MADSEKAINEEILRAATELGDKFKIQMRQRRKGKKASFWNHILQNEFFV